MQMWRSVAIVVCHGPKKIEVELFPAQTVNEESRSYQAEDHGRSADGRGLYTL